MERLELFDLSERFIELVNPTSPEKVVEAGRRMGLAAGTRVIDFGCGYAEPLVLWAEAFGIRGVGIDIRAKACARAQAKIAERGLGDRLHIVHGRAAEYAVTMGAFDAATCIGATFAFGGFEGTLEAMQRAVPPGARVAIGETHWLDDDVPATVVDKFGFHEEVELIGMARAEGFQLEGIVRSSVEDWDRYQSDNYRGQLAWLQENRGHPDYDQVLRWYLENQDEYLQSIRKHIGWAIYIFQRFDPGA